MRQALAEVAEAEVLQRGVDALADLAAADLAQLQTVGDVVEHGPVRPQRVGLEHQAEVAALGRDLELAGAVEHRLVLDADLAAVRNLEAGDRAQQRRLAAAGRAEQRDDLALAQLHRDPFQDRVVAIGQVQVVDAELRDRLARRGGLGAGGRFNHEV